MTPTEQPQAIGSAQTAASTSPEVRLRESLRSTVRLLVRQVVELSLWRLYGRGLQLFGRATAARSARGLVGRHVIPQLALLLIGQVTDTYKLIRAQLELDAYGRRSLMNATSTLGGVFGSAAGAAVGTLVAPGPGTAVGAMVGATLGSLGAEASVERWGPGSQPADAGAGAAAEALIE